MFSSCYFPLPARVLPLVCLFTGLSLVLPLGAQEQAAPELSPLEQGQKLVRERKFAEAERLLRRLIDANPRHEDAAIASLLRGRALLHLNRHDDARRDFEWVLSAHPRSEAAAEALEGLAILMQNRTIHRRSEMRLGMLITIGETEDLERFRPFMDVENESLSSDAAWYLENLEARLEGRYEPLPPGHTAKMVMSPDKYEELKRQYESGEMDEKMRDWWERYESCLSNTSLGSRHCSVDDTERRPGVAPARPALWPRSAGPR